MPIKLSDHGLILRRPTAEERDLLESDAGEWCVERPDGGALTPEQTAILWRLLEGEAVTD